MNVSVSEAKARFAELLKRVEDGEAIVVTRHGKPIARIEAVHGKGIRIGTLKGQIEMADDFDAPLEDFDDYR